MSFGDLEGVAGFGLGPDGWTLTTWRPRVGVGTTRGFTAAGRLGATFMMPMTSGAQAAVLRDAY